MDSSSSSWCQSTWLCCIAGRADLLIPGSSWVLASGCSSGSERTVLVAAMWTGHTFVSSFSLLNCSLTTCMSRGASLRACTPHLYVAWMLVACCAQRPSKDAARLVMSAFMFAVGWLLLYSCFSYVCCALQGHAGGLHCVCVLAVPTGQGRRPADW